MIVNLGPSPDQQKMARLIIEVMSEVSRAEELFPNWPKDIFEQALIVAEESGEVCKAVLDARPHDPHKGSMEDVRTELIQTAAMAFRMLLNLKEEK